MKRRMSGVGLCASAISILLAAESEGYEIFPGPVWDPNGLQMAQNIVYNPVLDNYLVLYDNDARAVIGQLSTAGVFSNPVAISDDLTVTFVNGAFNSDQETFLIVYRSGPTQEIFGQYLNNDGTVIGSAFTIGIGNTPNVDFSPESGRYVVTWQKGDGTIRYRVIDGDSTASVPQLTAPTVLTNGLSDGLAYGDVAQKFLVVYVRDLGGTQKANVYGRFLSADGVTVGPEFPITNAAGNQQTPQVGYASSTNRWMVVYENWSGCAGCPDVSAALVNDSGTVVKNFKPTGSSGWDVPGPIVFDPVTGYLYAGFKNVFSNVHIESKVRAFDPSTGAPIGPSVLLSNEGNQSIESAAARPDPVNPQVTFLWRIEAGGNGIHAGIVNLTPPIPDTFPPADVTDLSGNGVAEGTLAPATAIASTNPGPSGTYMKRTTDGNLTSYWASLARATMTPEFIVWDLGSEKVLSQMSLRSKTTGNLFPVDYQIQVSSDNVDFLTVANVTGASPARGTWVDHPLPLPSARYVKLLITKTNKTGTGLYMAQLAEVEFLESSGLGAIDLHWTAPGDDEDTGTAAGYELRWSSSPINAGNFASATLLPTGAPAEAGNLESLTFSGFPMESLVYFALKSRDEVPNVSGLSNVATIGTLGVPPAPVQGFGASSPGGTTVHLTWLPSGDDGNSGNATSYDIRYSTSPITGQNFESAASVIRPATNPKPPFESFTLGGLGNQTTYYFAIKALDEVGNKSLINEGAPVTETTLDVVGPAAIADLAVEAGGIAGELARTAIAVSSQLSSTTSRAKAVDGSPTTYWSSIGRAAQQPESITLDLGGFQSIGRVDLLSRSNTGALFPEDLEVQVSSDNSNFTTVATGVDLPATPGTLHTIDFPPVTGRYVRIYVTGTRLSAGGLYYAQIAEIDVWEAFPMNVLTIRWTEPGDDGATGTAASFDVRYSLSPISNFDTASPIVGEPAPQGTGSEASFHFEAPMEGATLFFRMKAGDEANNLSGVSNQVSVLVPPDVTAPGNVTDLTGSAPVTVGQIPAPAIAASSQASASTAFGKATDGDPSTYWGSLGTPLPLIQWITLDTGAPHLIGGVRLQARSAGALFPEDVEIQVSDDNLIFATVHTATGLPPTKGLTHAFEFPAHSGRYLRVNVTKPRLSGGGLYYAQIGEIFVDEATFNVGPVSLSWTAPGDNGPTGTATAYELRYSTSPIPDLAAFALATPVPGMPSPQAAGSHESVEVPAVQVPDDPGTYYFALRTRDEASNFSGLSNIAVIIIP
jgi:hypothetical protein